MTTRHVDRLPPFDRIATRTFDVDGEEVTRTFWMGRADYPARTATVSLNTRLSFSDTRFYVKALPGVDWRVDNRFRVDGGNWLVKGVSMLGTRGSILELLCS